MNTHFNKYINHIYNFTGYEREMGFSKLGAGIARRRMGAEMDQQAQAYESQQQQAQQQIEAQQRQIELYNNKNRNNLNPNHRMKI